jgi:hypothetical protein
LSPIPFTGGPVPFLHDVFELHCSLFLVGLKPSSHFEQVYLVILFLLSYLAFIVSQHGILALLWGQSPLPCTAARPSRRHRHARAIFNRERVIVRVRNLI